MGEDGGVRRVGVRDRDEAVEIRLPGEDAGRHRRCQGDDRGCQGKHGLEQGDGA